jgi:hypothetical protein
MKMKHGIGRRGFLLLGLGALGSGCAKDVRRAALFAYAQEELQGEGVSGAAVVDTSGHADAAGAEAPDLGAVLQQQLAGLRRSVWQCRTRLQESGVEVVEVLHKVRVDAHGDLTRSLVSVRQRGEVAPGGRAPAAEALAGWEAAATRMADLAFAYSINSLGAVLRVAGAHPPVAQADGSRCFSGSGALMPEDRVVVVLGGAGVIEMIRFEAVLDGAPVAGEVQFRAMPDGLRYPARTVVRCVQEGRQATVDNYGFRGI